MLGRATCVAAERDGLDVCADERVPFGALAEVDLRQAKRRPSFTQSSGCLTFRANVYQNPAKLVTPTGSMSVVKSVS